jgi:intracellular sulfur oxidation DsrE/DsrF family protein
MNLLRAFALSSLCLAGTAAAAPMDLDAKDFWQTPAIQGYGPMHPLPDAAYQPQKDQTYKILFLIEQGSDKPGEVNHSLEAVARAINVFASAGVPPEHLKIVTLISGPAAPLVLDDEHYKAQLGVGNPNLALIHKLHAAGVDFAVCGQAALKKRFQFDWINPEIKPALSALSTEILLQSQGYALVTL